ncbi:MAG: chemotactic signal-response protein chel [Alphaproteobacteria bacterium]|nr:chemotactic signal-response protein chel [Alphaproteobacteria bacterium]
MSALNPITSGSLPIDTSAIANQAAKRPNLTPTADPAAARKTAQEFEGFFLSQMFQSMFQGIKTDGPFGGGHGEDMFRGMLMQEYGKSVAQKGGVGIADAVYKQILLMQEKNSEKV